MSNGIYSGGNRVTLEDSARIVTWTIMNETAGSVAAVFRTTLEVEFSGRFRQSTGGTNSGSLVTISKADDQTIDDSEMTVKQMIGTPAGAVFSPQERRVSSTAPIDFESRLIRFVLNPGETRNYTYESDSLLDKATLTIYWQESD